MVVLGIGGEFLAYALFLHTALPGESLKPRTLSLLAVAGALIAEFGAGWAFLLNALSFVGQLGRPARQSGTGTSTWVKRATPPNGRWYARRPNHLVRQAL